jgi:CheY-like chemotaxis protein
MGFRSKVPRSCRRPGLWPSGQPASPDANAVVCTPHAWLSGNALPYGNYEITKSLWNFRTNRMCLPFYSADLSRFDTFSVRVNGSQGDMPGMSGGANLPFSGRGPDEAMPREASQSGPRGENGSANTPTSERSGERRIRRRAVISAPVRVRSAEGEISALDEISATIDVSRNGFLFVSARADFSRGMIVAVTFPYSQSPIAIQAERPGRVVRVAELSDGRHAVAIAFDPGRLSVPVDASPATALECGNGGPLPGAVTPAAGLEERPLVIVVDSDPGVRTLLRTFLEELGYEVMALHGARQAHALLDQMLPALVIAEIEGRDLPGYDLCARIKSTERLRGVPVVLTTQCANPSDYSNAHSLGAVVCIAKPFRMDRIQRVVELLVPTRAALGHTGAPGPGQRDRRSGFDRRRIPDPGRRAAH